MQKWKPPKVQAREVTYELHSLGWKAFQNLCVTITGEVWGQVVQSYFDSHDGGRDGAFHGTWKAMAGESFQGAFTAQCKFTAKADKNLQLSDLKDEVAKAQRLASCGLADNYILFTNARLMGTTEENIRKVFGAIPGIKRFAAYGCERISQIIHESPRLRMLVPRIYGLGDLSQILDERAYAQAHEILSALGDDLAKFVITDAYQKSAKALVEHGFVLLLGEPACGKSTIAAALAVGALDEWGCSTVKIRDADDFVKHSNPHEPKQFFWVDDAFGATQFDWSSASAWNRVFPHIHAAIHRGAKVLFTSRDYIYRTARAHLKESALPVMKESQVVINVESLSKEEREQILYNHIRLGTQSREYKKQLKSFLPNVAAHLRFSPEIARRLGNPMFTKQLNVSQSGLDTFEEKPLELLCEIIRTLDADSRSSLALVFMRAGTLPSPVEMTTDEQRAVTLLGGSIERVRAAFNALNGSLLIQLFQEGSYMWRFKHPTIRDAFATLVSEDTELMDIYLAGTPIEKLFGEVSCGDVGIEGVKVIIPTNRYNSLIARIEAYLTESTANMRAVHIFFAHRCDRTFLECYVASQPQFINSLNVSSYFYAVSDVDVIARLHEFGLLPEQKRLDSVEKIRNLAIEIPDSGFLRKGVRSILNDRELEDVLEYVQSTLLPKLDEYINNWRSGYISGEDPENYFYELSGALQDYRDEFSNNKGTLKAVIELDHSLKRIDKIIDELRDELPDEPDEEFYRVTHHDEEQVGSRSIFDDVDL